MPVDERVRACVCLHTCSDGPRSDESTRDASDDNLYIQLWRGMSYARLAACIGTCRVPSLRPGLGRSWDAAEKASVLSYAPAWGPASAGAATGFWRLLPCRGVSGMTPCHHTVRGRRPVCVQIYVSVPAMHSASRPAARPSWSPCLSPPAVGQGPPCCPDWGPLTESRFRATAACGALGSEQTVPTHIACHGLLCPSSTLCPSRRLGPMLCRPPEGRFGIAAAPRYGIP